MNREHAAKSCIVRTYKRIRTYKGMCINCIMYQICIVIQNNTKKNIKNHEKMSYTLLHKTKRQVMAGPLSHDNNTSLQKQHIKI